MKFVSRRLASVYKYIIYASVCVFFSFDANAVDPSVEYYRARTIKTLKNRRRPLVFIDGIGSVFTV